MTSANTLRDPFPLLSIGFIALWIIVVAICSTIIAFIFSANFKFPFDKLMPVSMVVGYSVSLISIASSYASAYFLLRLKPGGLIKSGSYTVILFLIILILALGGSLTGLILIEYVIEHFLFQEIIQNLKQMASLLKPVALVTTGIITLTACAFESLRYNNKIYIQKIARIKKSEKEKYFIINQINKKLKVKYSDILYFTAHGKKTIIHTAVSDFEISYLIKEINRILPEEKFLRIHRRHIVNLEKVMSTSLSNSGEYEVFLNDEEETIVPVGRKYRVLLKSIFSKE